MADPKARFKDFLIKNRIEILILSSLYLWYLYSLLPLPFVQASDGYWLWVPRLTFAVKEIMSARLPFWNEYQFCGTTLLADANTSILNPLTVLYFFLNPLWAYSLEVLLLFAFSIITTWFYFRERGFSREASIIGATGYLYSGQVLFWSLYHGMNLSLGLFPCTLLAFRKFEKTQKRGWRNLAFILIFFSAAGGFIQFSLIAAFSCLIEGLERFSLGEVKRIFRSRFFTVILALTSASFTIAPIIEAGLFSHRKLISYFTELIPHKFDLLPMVLYGTSFNRHGYPNYFYYIGIVLISLSVLAIRKIPKKVIGEPFFLYSLIFPAILFFVYSGILPLTFQFRIESDPWRGMFIFILSLSILSAKALDILVNHQKSKNTSLLLPYELLIAGAVTLVIALYKFELSDFLASDKVKVFAFGLFLTALFFLALILKIKKADLAIPPAAFLVFGLILMFIFMNGSFLFILSLPVLLFIFLILLLKEVKLPFKAGYLKYCIVIMLAANCFSMGNYLANNVKHDAKGETNPWKGIDLPADFFLKKGRLVTIGSGIDYLEDWGIYNNIRGIGGYGSFFPKTTFLRMKKDKLLPEKFDAATHFRNNNVLNLDVLTRYGVSHLISGKSAKVDPLKEGWRLVKGSGTNLIYSNPKFVGRSYLLDEKERLIKGVDMLENSGLYVKVAFEASSGDTLILADSWFPGWECFVNGSRAEGFDAEGFRGYRVERAGFYEVEWIYRPAAFLIGLAIFLVSILIFIRHK